MPNQTPANFHFPVKIISGENATAQLADELGRLGLSRPLIITDQGIIAAGLMKRISDVLEGASLAHALFDGVLPDPGSTVVEKAAKLAIKEKCDSLIALGGGSSIDTAKGVSILATNQGKIADYEGIVPRYPNEPLPIITLPTTAGSGSEISSAAIITDKKRNFKMVVKSAGGQIFAKAAILDPLNLAGIPARTAAETGIDALSHALEAAVSKNATFMTDALSFQATRLIFQNLAKFVSDTSQVAVALNMQNASSMAGIAMTTGGLGLMHAMAHPLGAYAKISHGMACALLLPHVLRHNLVSRVERYAELAAAINPLNACDCAGDRELAERLVLETDLLLDDLRLPRSLSEMNISLKLSDRIIDDAFESYLSKINPRATSRGEIKDLFEMVL